MYFSERYLRSFGNLLDMRAVSCRMQYIPLGLLLYNSVNNNNNNNNNNIV